MSSDDISHLHEQDAAGTGAFTSARWLGWTWYFGQVRSASVRNLRQIGHRAGAFDKFLEGSHDRGASEEFAEEVDLAAKLVVRNRLDELFCDGTSYGVVLGDLRGGRAGDSKGFAFTSKLRHQAHSLRASCVNRSPG